MAFIDVNQQLKASVPSSVRSAEKDRESSCLFADRVAKLSISTFQSVCPRDLQESYKQTVLASFIIQRVNVPRTDGNFIVSNASADTLRVVSLGVGTKVLPHKKVISEFQHGEITGLGGRLVRDCHAEVLARRGLLKYLYGELNRLLKAENDEKKMGVECSVDKDGSNISDGDEGIRDGKIESDISDSIRPDLSSSPVTSAIQSTSKPTSHSPNHTITGFEPFTVNPATGLLKLKEEYTLHLYTSSQPCGNATIKKWAKGKKAKSYPLLAAWQYPDTQHSRLQITARNEGQVSLLAKKNGHTSASTTCTYNDDIDSESKSNKVPSKNTKQEENVSNGNNAENKSNIINQNSDKNKNNKGNNDNNEGSEKRVLDCRDDPPPGTVYPLPQNRVRKDIPKGGGVDGSVGSIMCCSDKMAKWNAIGVQGGLLSSFFEPLYIRTVTVGRKFSGIPLERALCCRLQDFRLNNVEVKKKGMKRNKDKEMRGEEKDQTGQKYGEEEEEEGGKIIGEIVVEVEKKLREEVKKEGLVVKDEEGEVTKEEDKEGVEVEKKGELEKNLEQEIMTQRRSLYFIHHPVMMCTSIKLDNSAILTGITERKVTTNHINTKDSDDNDISDNRNNEQINNNHNDNDSNDGNYDNKGENIIDDSENPVNDGAVFSEIKCFCRWLENTDLGNTDSSLHENDQNFKNSDNVYDRGNREEGKDANIDNEKQKRKSIGVIRRNFVIIDSREGLGLKQDYNDDKNKPSDCVDYEKNNDNDSNNGNNGNNCKNNHKNNNNNNDNDNDNNDSYDNTISNNNNDKELFRDKNNNICPVEITEKTNHEISAISSYALFTDFKNILNRLIKCENNETVQNYLQGTYTENKDKSFIFLRNNQVSFPVHLDSDNNAGICHDIHKHYDTKNIRSVYRFRENGRLSSNPYSEAKRTLLTDIRFFQDWVRKKDFISV